MSVFGALVSEVGHSGATRRAFAGVWSARPSEPRVATRRGFDGTAPLPPR
jgi:hypothetical protein